MLLKRSQCEPGKRCGWIQPNMFDNYLLHFVIEMLHTPTHTHTHFIEIIPNRLKNQFVFSTRFIIIIIRDISDTLCADIWTDIIIMHI